MLFLKIQHTAYKSSFSHEIQEQAVRVVHPGFFDKNEEKWNEDEEEEDVE